ncbi:MAG: hypothetical protein IRY99_03290 [Isosphaeraceae bacterium]|nr:hypothetical protein [Isosphaeraceae bacterium]
MYHRELGHLRPIPALAPLLIRLDNPPVPAGQLDWTQGVSDLNYLVAPAHPRVAIIGVGAGPQLKTALAFSPQSVLAIDINPAIIAWDKGEDSAVNEHIFHRPEVTVEIDEGRHAIRSHAGQFDVMVMHAIDTYTAASAGAYSLSENNLYTVEAFKDFYAKLSPDGVMSIRRALFYPPRENLRLFTTILQALTELGIEHPENHIVVLSPVRDWKRPSLFVWGYLLFSKRPFSGERLAVIDEYVASHQWSYLYRPGKRLDTPFSDFVASSNREQFYRDYPYFVKPCYDSNPFFFQLVRPFAFLNPKGMWSKGILPNTAVLYNRTTYTLFYTLIMLLVLTYLLLALPTARYWRRANLTRPPWAVTIYFGCLGLGFMAVEIVSIQIMTLFLGHPVYALGVNLLGPLAFAGIGSALSRRLPTERAPAVCLLIALLAVVAGFGLLPLIHSLISAPFWARIAVTLSYLGLIGIPMGMPMALGIRQIGEEDRPLVAWAWACNGAAAVVGTNLCMIFMVYLGMMPVFLTGGACYLLAGTLLTRISQPAPSLELASIG